MRNMSCRHAGSPVGYPASFRPRRYDPDKLRRGSACAFRGDNGRREVRFDAEIAQKLDARHQRQAVERLERNAGIARQFREPDPRRDKAEAGIAVGEQAQQRLDAGVFHAANLGVIHAPAAARHILQRLQPVEDQKRAAPLDEMRQLHALLARVSRRLPSAEMPERGLEEIVGAGLAVFVRALAVEAPGEDRLRAAPAGRLQRLHEVIDERCLARAAHGVEGEDFGAALVPRLVQCGLLALAAVQLLCVGVRQLGDVDMAVTSESKPFVRLPFA